MTPKPLRPMTVSDHVGQRLGEIEQADLAGNYETRNRYVYEILAIAAIEGWPCGVRLDPAEPEWPVVYIDLPGAGQVSWHVPQYPEPWDGHTTAEKYERAAQYAALPPV